MKTLKYRSIVGALGVAVLSVFLFTACEKESEGIPKKPDRLSKFKALTFTGETASATSSAGTGTFTGTGSNNITFVPPGDDDNLLFAPALEDGQAFTDPRATGSGFSIASGFTLGGGTVTFEGKSYTIAFGICASSDMFGFTEDIDGSSNQGTNDDLDMFIGIAGDFNFEDENADIEDPSALLLYAFSYNGGSSIGGFNDFENGTVDNKAFVIAVKFDEDINNVGLYFATSGTVNFSGANVTMSGVKMAKVEEDPSSNNFLGSRRSNLSAFLECGSFNFSFESED